MYIHTVYFSMALKFFKHYKKYEYISSIVLQVEHI